MVHQHRSKIVITILFPALLLLFSTCSSESRVSVRSISYQDWDGGIEVSNADTRLVVVPDIGRIMHYSTKGNENLLWTNPVFNGITKPSG